MRLSSGGDKFSVDGDTFLWWDKPVKTGFFEFSYIPLDYSFYICYTVKEKRCLVLLIETILSRCNDRNTEKECEQCSYNTYCPHDCGKCLEFIHYPQRSPHDAPKRQYDCRNMADYYACKYSCRYTSEIVYALERYKDLPSLSSIKVLSFGCGPCTDLFALDYLRTERKFSFQHLEYRGVDYNQYVWSHIHHDIEVCAGNNIEVKYYYADACELIHTIAQGTWIPNLIVFQYVFSDMRRNTNRENIDNFINEFARFYNTKVRPNAYVIINDINANLDNNGGREYFDILSRRLNNSDVRRGYFYNENSKTSYYSGGYPYGRNSIGQFPCNGNRFDIRPWSRYVPFQTCASAQMIIKKR